MIDFADKKSLSKVTPRSFFMLNIKESSRKCHVCEMLDWYELGSDSEGRPKLISKMKFVYNSLIAVQCGSIDV